MGTSSFGPEWICLCSNWGVINIPTSNKVVFVILAYGATESVTLLVKRIQKENGLLGGSQDRQRLMLESYISIFFPHFFDVCCMYLCVGIYMCMGVHVHLGVCVCEGLRRHLHLIQ